MSAGFCMLACIKCMCKLNKVLTVKCSAMVSILQMRKSQKDVMTSPKFVQLWSGRPGSFQSVFLKPWLLPQLTNMEVQQRNLNLFCSILIHNYSTNYKFLGVLILNLHMLLITKKLFLTFLWLDLWDLHKVFRIQGIDSFRTAQSQKNIL